MPIRHASSIIFALSIATCALGQQHAAPPGVQKTDSIRQTSPYLLNIQLKARSIIVDPAEPGALHEVLDDATPMGVPSPDGKHIAFIGSDPERVKDGHDFDLFVADVDAAQPSGQANMRRITTDQIRPTNPVWLPGNDGLVFLAQRSADDANEQAWFIDLAPNSVPMRLSDDNAERAWQAGIAPGGDIAFVQLNNRKSKEQFSDLIVQRPPNRPGRESEGGGRRIVLHDQHISSYAFSPDGKTLAWSGLGSMYLVNLTTGESREILLHGIHRQLLNHTVEEFAWRPDGKVLAIRCGFLGGIARALDGDPNAPWPRMFAADKVFFVPINWMPSADSLKVGEGKDFPSPTADDPKAEISPPAGDESKPWWVRDLPMRALEMNWIAAANAQARINKHN